MRRFASSRPTDGCNEEHGLPTESFLPADVSSRSECVQTSKDAEVPRKPLALVAQLPEFPQFVLAQRRPTTEEKRHTLIAMTPRVSKLFVVEQ